MSVGWVGFLLLSPLVIYDWVVGLFAPQTYS